jgi:hypothetical protein
MTFRNANKNTTELSKSIERIVLNETVKQNNWSTKKSRQILTMKFDHLYYTRKPEKINKL